MFAKELLLTCFLVGYGDFVSQACYNDRANLFQDTANSNVSKYQQRALRKSSTNTIEKTIKHKGEANKAFVFDQVFYQSSEEFGDTGRNCGTQDLPLSEQQKTQQEVDEFLLENFGESGARRLQEIQQITVNTYIHIVYRNNSTDPTNVPDAIVNKQMAVLNDAFSGRSLDYSDCNNNPPTGFATPFRFKLAAVTRTLNDTWHYSWQNSTMAGVLRQGNCSDLNIFIHTPKYGKLGLSSFPSDCNDQNLLKDYVSLHWQTLPDSSWSPFNEGDTLVHEIGHWLGLFHTFEGGCSYIGDSVQDTPREKRPARGCPIGLDTCGSAGLDPVTNYMDYTDDCCMFTFTSGQVTRMIELSMTFRKLSFSAANLTSKSPTYLPSPVTEPVTVAQVRAPISPQPSDPTSAPVAVQSKKSIPVSIPTPLSYPSSAARPNPTLAPAPREASDPYRPTPVIDQLNITGPRSCLEGQLLVEVILRTDSKPQETSWEIVDGSLGTTEHSFQVGPKQKLTIISTRVCLDESKYYYLIINDSGGDGMKKVNQGCWRLRVNGLDVDRGNRFLYHDGFIGFGTWPVCQNPSESMVSILLKTDDRGEESSWFIRDAKTKKVIASNQTAYESNMLYVIHQCVPVQSDLIFAIIDSGTNGLCCDDGQGFFSFYHNQKVLLKGEVFDRARSIEFAT